jgi:hypothetical protein
MKRAAHRSFYVYSLGLFVCAIAALPILATSPTAASLHNSRLSVAFSPQDGPYEIRAAGLQAPILKSSVGAEVNHQWLRSRIL